MTTNYKLSNGNDIDSVLLPRAGNSDTGSLVIYGNTAYQNGAMLGVYGKSHSTRPGQVLLSASTGSDATTDVVIKPGDGLYVGGKKVLVDGDSAGSGGGSSSYQIPYATCSTAKSTGAKVATITNGASFSLVAGAIVAVKYTNNPSNTTNVSTLNVNETGAKAVKNMQIWYGQESHNASMSAYHTNGVYLYVYDGTYWNEFVRMYREADEGLG